MGVQEFLGAQQLSWGHQPFGKLPGAPPTRFAERAIELIGSGYTAAKR